MSERLLITFDPAEGALVRMLGLIERRGYSLGALTMEARADGASMVVDFGPRDRSRHTEVLVRQLARLVEIQTVSIITPRERFPA